MHVKNRYDCASKWSDLLPGKGTLCSSDEPKANRGKQIAIVST